MNLDEKLSALQSEFQNDFEGSKSLDALEALKVKYLGKKGSIQSLMQYLRHVDADQRPLAGQKINDLKISVANHLENAVEEAKDRELAKRLSEEWMDVSLPGRSSHLGGLHVVRQMINRAVSILSKLGFSVQEGPEIESDFYNFEALNFPHDHPSRDMQDTFYISPGTLLRTHTSNVQVRVMEGATPPMRVLAMGKCYRSEDISARSHVLFHQIEAFYIDHNVSFKDLLFTLKQFFNELFGRSLEMRFRPSFFPFVEPGIEVDIECFLCGGKGCAVCKHTGWLEVAGAGMIHPEVLKNGGIEPEEFSGYAWALGIERLVMLRHGISDIRLFMENNQRFLEQFV